jgi:hypothetical protein
MIRREESFPADEALRKAADEMLTMEHRITEISETLGAEEGVRLAVQDVFKQMWRLLKIPLVECVSCGRKYPSALAKIEDFEFRCDRCAGKSTVLRQGTSISTDRYQAVRSAILNAVPRNRKGISFKDLSESVAAKVPKALFAGASISWYTTAVKLDLEARGLIERVPGSHPQELRRK